MLEYAFGNIEDFIEKNWSPTIIAYNDATELNTSDGIYMGFVDVDTISDLILRLSIKRCMGCDIAGKVVFMAHQFMFQQLGFHTNEIQEAVLEEPNKLVEWQIKFLDVIEEFDKTKDLTVREIFTMILTEFDPRKNRLETSKTEILKITQIPEENLPQEEYDGCT